MKGRFIFSILIAGIVAATACERSVYNSANDHNGSSGSSGHAEMSPTSSPGAPVPAATLRPATDDAPEPTPILSPLPPDAPGVFAAIAVIHDYYAAINAGNFRKAYELWSGKGEASRQTFEQFREGFADTAAVDVDTSGEPGDLEGAAGSQYVTIPVRITARTRSGKVQRFVGEYVLRRSMVDGATADQRAWRIYSASIQER